MICKVKHSVKTINNKSLYSLGESERKRVLTNRTGEVIIKTQAGFWLNSSGRLRFDGGERRSDLICNMFCSWIINWGGTKTGRKTNLDSVIKTSPVLCCLEILNLEISFQPQFPLIWSLWFLYSFSVLLLSSRATVPWFITIVPIFNSHQNLQFPLSFWPINLHSRWMFSLFMLSNCQALLGENCTTL